MLILKIIAILIIIFIISVVIEERKSKNETKRGIYYTDNATYLGGFSTIQGDKPVKVEVEMDNIFLNFEGSNRVLKAIRMTDLINAEIKSEQQIQREVSLGKLFLFGALSFGMDKKVKTVVNNFLILTFNDNQEKRNVILKSNNLETLTKKIREVKFREY